MGIPNRHLRKGAAPGAEQKLQALLRAQRRDAPELFSDREEDAKEYDSIVRRFVAVHDETLSAEPYG